MQEFDLNDEMVQDSAERLKELIAALNGTGPILEMFRIVYGPGPMMHKFQSDLSVILQSHYELLSCLQEPQM